MWFQFTSTRLFLNSRKTWKWNVTPLIRRGSNFYFFGALYFTLLTNCPAFFQLGNIQLFNGNLINLTCFWGKAPVNKLWPLLYKRAELDLWLTKFFKYFLPASKVYLPKSLSGHDPGLDTDPSSIWSWAGAGQSRRSPVWVWMKLPETLRQFYLN